MKCELVNQGYPKGNCNVLLKDGESRPACQSTLKVSQGQYYRLIKSCHLSRPEDYLSLYQSGCNLSCLNCHSWEFSQRENGRWMSTDDLANLTARYEEDVTVWEPRERALMTTATDLCYHCGRCVVGKERGRLCPYILKPEQITWGPQGYGPARNIVAFTGGDLTCQANFYVEVAKKIKKSCDQMWLLLETNGLGLTPRNLDALYSAGVDSFWLDIKAFDSGVHERLCGAPNKVVLESPAEIIDRGFVLEVLTLYIPGFVERDQVVKIAELVAGVDLSIPFIILAFFPQHKLLDFRPPTLHEMLDAHSAAKGSGLKTVKLANLGVFTKSDEDFETLLAKVGREGIG